jgi:uncharacterized protein YdaU (DUF1376 family)
MSNVLWLDVDSRAVRPGGGAGDGAADMKAKARAKSDIWMKLYVGDYLADTAHLNAAQHGAYLLLLMHQFRKGFVPKEASSLAQIAHCTAQQWARHVGPVVLPFFTETPSGYVQKRLLQISMDAFALASARAVAANRRWDLERSKNNDVTDANASGLHGGSISKRHESQSQIKKVRKNNPAPVVATPFEPAPDGSPPAHPTTPAKRADHGSRIPEGWTPDDAGRAFAAKLGLPVDATADEFRDYWRGVAGAKARKVDWAATWRVNCRRIADNRANTRSATTNGRHRETADEARARKLGVRSLLDYENNDVPTLEVPPRATLK